MVYQKDLIDKSKNPLRSELEKYEKQGVELWLDGRPSTPKSILRAYKIAEKGDYMRDYVYTEDGDVKLISFNYIRKLKD